MVVSPLPPPPLSRPIITIATASGDADISRRAVSAPQPEAMPSVGVTGFKGMEPSPFSSSVRSKGVLSPQTSHHQGRSEERGGGLGHSCSPVNSGSSGGSSRRKDFSGSKGVTRNRVGETSSTSPSLGVVKGKDSLSSLSSEGEDPQAATSLNPNSIGMTVQRSGSLSSSGTMEEVAALSSGGKESSSDDECWGGTAVVFSIGLYSFVSIAIVFLNRHMFSKSFQFPIFVSWVQQLVGVFLYTFVARMGQLIPGVKFFPTVSFEPGIARSILPLSLAFVGMIAFSNTCLKYVQVSTYQVARSLTLLFNLLLTRVMLHERVSILAWAACLVVMSGFVVGSFDPDTLSLKGILTGAISSLFQAYYNVKSKAALKVVDNDHNALLYYNVLLSSFLFVPIIFIAGENEAFEALPIHPQSPGFLSTWSMLVGSGMLGVVLTFSSYFCIKTTGPVTFNVVGYAKACVQSLGGIAFLGEVVTAKSLTGILLTLGGSFGYSQVKIREMDRKGNTKKKEEEERKKERRAPKDTKDRSEETLELINIRCANGTTSGPNPRWREDGTQS